MTLSPAEKQSIQLATELAKTAKAELLDDRKLLMLKGRTVKHTIERLGSIQNLLQSVLT